MSSFGAHYGATTAAAAASYPYDRTSMYSYGAGMQNYMYEGTFMEQTEFDVHEKISHFSKKKFFFLQVLKHLSLILQSIYQSRLQNSQNLPPH